MKQNYISQEGALKELAKRITNQDTGNYEDYIDYCEFNELDPKNVRGIGQSHHSYALALVGLGLEFEYKNEYNPEVNLV